MTSPLAAVRELRIRADGDIFRAELGVPRHPAGVIVLLRDNGNTVRGNALAYALRESGFATAVCDALTRAERAHAAKTRRLPLDPERLSRRLGMWIDAVASEPDCRTLARGVVVAGLAASAALQIATARPNAFDAVACRQANLTWSTSFDRVRAATLFLAMAGDLARIRPMTRAFQQLRCPRHFEILPAISNERSFALASALTASWMRRHVGRDAAARGERRHA
jgi:hypothetical protein